MLHGIWNWNIVAEQSNFKKLAQIANCHNLYLCDFLQYLKASFVTVIHNHIFPFLYFLFHMNRFPYHPVTHTLCTKQLAHECMHMWVHACTHTHTHTHNKQGVSWLHVNTSTTCSWGHSPSETSHEDGSDSHIFQWYGYKLQAARCSNVSYSHCPVYTISKDESILIHPPNNNTWQKIIKEITLVCCWADFDIK